MNIKLHLTTEQEAILKAYFELVGKEALEIEFSKRSVQMAKSKILEFKKLYEKVSTLKDL